MTILITSDIHLSANPRDAYRQKFMAKLPTLARKHKAEAIFILGDYTEEKDAHSAELVNAVVSHIADLSTVCPVVLLKGNHDWLSSPDTPFFGFLRHLESVSWVSRPTPSGDLKNVPTTVLKALGRGAIFLPATPNPDRDWAGIDFRKYDWAFAHQTFAGAEGDSGFKLSGTSLSIFSRQANPKKLTVVSGDVHRAQRFDNLIYVGSPYLVDFGDDFEPRVLLIDGKEGLKSISCEGPQKRLVVVRSVADLRSVRGLNPGDILKVRVEVSPSQHAEWAEIAAQVREWGAKGRYEVHAVQPVVKANTKSMITSRKDAPKRSDSELLADYAKHRGVDANTLKAGAQLLEEA